MQSTPIKLLMPNYLEKIYVYGNNHLKIYNRIAEAIIVLEMIGIQQLVKNRLTLVNYKKLSHTCVTGLASKVKQLLAFHI
jgi:hypothetical protein